MQRQAIDLNSRIKKKIRADIKRFKEELGQGEMFCSNHIKFVIAKNKDNNEDILILSARTNTNTEYKRVKKYCLGASYDCSNYNEPWCQFYSYFLGISIEQARARVNPNDFTEVIRMHGYQMVYEPSLEWYVIIGPDLEEYI